MDHNGTEHEITFHYKHGIGSITMTKTELNEQKEKVLSNIKNANKVT